MRSSLLTGTQSNSLGKSEKCITPIFEFLSQISQSNSIGYEKEAEVSQSQQIVQFLNIEKFNKLMIKQQQQQNLKDLRRMVRGSLYLKLSDLPKPTQVEEIIHHSSKQNYQEASFNDLYEMGSTIGQGAHGIVKKCKLRGGEEELAVKKIFRAGDPELINTIIATFQINRQLNDLPQVCRAVDLFINEQLEQAHWVMEVIHYKSLQKQIKHFEKNQIKEIITQLAVFLKILHDRGICHRDLKPDNILVDITDGVHIKIIDFGVSRRFYKMHKIERRHCDMWTRTGSVLYSAPEIFDCCGYNEKIDIWAIGIILYQMLSGKLPFHCETQMENIEMIQSENFQIWNTKEFHAFCPLEQDLLKRMLNKDPNKRLSANELTLHPWINKEHPLHTMDDTSIRPQHLQLHLTLSVNLSQKKIFIGDPSNHIHYVHKINSFEKGDVGSLIQQSPESCFDYKSTDDMSPLKAKDDIKEFNLQSGSSQSLSHVFE